MMRQYSINCNGKLLELSQPVIMGIINATPDSFYTQGRLSDTKGILHTAHNMIQEGATILDIGGLSTKPGNASITVREELDRVLPALEQIRRHFPNVIISVDTYRSEVAKAAYQYGADMINDISAGSIDAQMLPTVALCQLPYIMMHMKGTPLNMQEAPTYSNVVQEVLQYCSQKIHDCRVAGINDVIVDPGFGFGKTVEHNYSLLKQLSAFQLLEVPVLVGVSRKSMLYKPLAITAEDALNATTAAHVLALEQGAQLLRVHDVKAAKEAVAIWTLYKNA